MSYLEAAFPGGERGARSPAVLREGSWERRALTAGLALCGAAVNYLGLDVVGGAAVGATAFIVAPFVALVALAAPKHSNQKLEHHRPRHHEVGRVHQRDVLESQLLGLGLDAGRRGGGTGQNAAQSSGGGRAAGRRDVPAAAAGRRRGASRTSTEGWSLGYFAAVASRVGGPWLAWWVVAAAAVSAAGQFEAEMSSDAFLLLGMAQRGFLPARLAGRSTRGTPGLAIALSSTGILLLVPLSFLQIVDLLNAVYCLAQLLEFAAFVALRVRAPHLKRPFRVPLSTLGCVLMLAPATALLAVLLALPFVEKNWTMVAWTGGIVLPACRCRPFCPWLGPGAGAPLSGTRRTISGSCSSLSRSWRRRQQQQRQRQR